MRLGTFAQKKSLRHIIFGCGLIFGLSVQPFAPIGIAHAKAASPSLHSPDLKAFTLDIAKNILIPRYRALAQATTAQHSAWQAYCAAPSDANLATTKVAFQQVAKDWARVSYWNFGPITLSLRANRMQHWPERRNAVTRALSHTLASDSTPNYASLRTGSVAIQGLPALERLLFDPDFANPPQARKCAIATAITENMAAIATHTLQEWTQKDGMYAALKRGKHPIFFSNWQDASRQMMTAVITGYQIIADQKLLPVMAKDIEKANPKKAEYWRSGLSWASIAAQAAALAEDSRIILKYHPENAAPLARIATFADAFAAPQPIPLATAVQDATQRPRLTALFAVVQTTKNALITDFPAALGVALGFNALDGD
jgi:predicted lipoprotein